MTAPAPAPAATTLASLIAGLLAPPELPPFTVTGAPALAPAAPAPVGAAPVVVASPPLGANLLAFPASLSVPVIPGALGLVAVPPGYTPPSFLHGFTIIGEDTLLANTMCVDPPGYSSPTAVHEDALELQCAINSPT